MYFLSKNKRGVKNTYRDGIPFSEKLIKDLGFQIREIINFFLNGFKHKSLLIYPDFPSSKTVIRKVCRILNINLTNKLDRHFDWVLYYEDETFRTKYEPLEALSNKRVVNLQSRDISKFYVDKIHEEVFGYSTQIDPLTFKGQGVRKSDINAKHDGEVLNFPLENKDSDSIYQILINNQVNDEEVLDMRIPLINYTIPLLYLKYRKVTERFVNSTTRTYLSPISDHLSETEQAQIIEFARKMNLEYGEFDVLRDLDSNKIYVVDVNNTPFGPPSNISKEQGKEAIAILAKTFKEAFLLQ